MPENFLRLKKKHQTIIWFLAAGLLLGGCTADFRLWGFHVGKDPQGFSLPINLTSKKVDFGKTAFNLSTPRPPGRIRGDPLCIFGLAVSTERFKRLYVSDFAKITKEVFYQMMENQGFMVTGRREDRLFDKTIQSDFTVSAIVRRIRFDNCTPWKSLSFLRVFGIDLRRNSKAYIELDVEWQLYNRKTKTIIYKTVSSGRYRKIIASPGGDHITFYYAIRRAILSLSEDKNFTNYLLGNSALPSASEG